MNDLRIIYILNNSSITISNQILHLFFFNDMILYINLQSTHQHPNTS